MSEFDGITGIDGWGKKLKELLTDAKQIARQNDIDKQLEMSDRLTDFMHESRPNTPEIKKLDNIAEEAAASILRQSIEERLAAVTARTAEYVRLAKDFESQAQENRDSADSIRLKNITQVVNSATGMIKSAKNLKESLKEPLIEEEEEVVE